ncbi:MAG: hypothetical protein HY820_24340 [Acidobacteria bacterium]|nr:hypothetical protein [Acidobacteriota bacterium]
MILNPGSGERCCEAADVPQEEPDPGRRFSPYANMNISVELLERIDKYRFKRMFPARSEAIEALLEVGLKVNPERNVKPTPEKGE